MIISRYLHKEIFYTVFSMTLLLLLLFLCNQTVHFLKFIATGKFPVALLLQLLAFEIPRLLVFLLPLGLYLGILLVYSRLYADNELRVLEICGFSRKQLILLTASAASLVTLFVVFLTIWVNPKVAEEKHKAEWMAAENIMDRVLPGRFQAISNGQRVVYVEKISRNRKTARNLFLAERKKGIMGEMQPRWIIVSAASGYPYKDPKTQDRYMVATDGVRYEGMPGKNNYKIIKFKKYAVRIEQATQIMSENTPDMVSTRYLWQHYENPKNAAELQWRIAIGISGFLLALLAIPLSHVKPRQGRYLLLLPAIFIYVIYVNLLFILRHWVEHNGMMLGLGINWVSLGLGLLALGLNLYQSGWCSKRVP